MNSYFPDPEMYVQILAYFLLVPMSESCGDWRVGLDSLVEDCESQGMNSELNSGGSGSH